jgi:hypothetical protein
MNAPVNAMQQIELLARTYREARDTLSERATALSDELEAAKRRSMRGLRNAAASVTKAGDELRAAIDENRALFVKPKSVVFSGVRCGLKKGRGTTDWDDDAQVVKLIRRHLSEQFEVLVKVTEKPLKDAMANLTAEQLKKIGVRVESSGDIVQMQDTTAEVDKLVKALLAGAEEEAMS